MTARPFQLPQDIDLMNALVIEGFQYPENPSWSIQDDEKQDLIDTIHAAKRMWPVIRMMQIFSPVLRDIMHGFIEEQEGRPVGLINFSRQRNVPEWWVGNVTVLPAYRRRGIARQLVRATLDDLHRRKARLAYLEVVDGNLPAFQLYKDIGFTAYAMSSLYDYSQDGQVEEIYPPEGYKLKLLSPFDWRARYEFSECAIPDSVKQYEPVWEERFRVPMLMALVGRLFNVLSGRKIERFAVYSANEQKIIGYGELGYRLRAGGVNQINLRLDPAHSALAAFIVRHALSVTQKASPGHRIEIQLENWGEALIQALEELGGEKRVSNHRMGYRFQT